ncbi:MAG: hypothetical protein QM687_10065 [Ferruginibacter sp.]
MNKRYLFSWIVFFLFSSNPALFAQEVMPMSDILKHHYKDSMPSLLYQYDSIREAHDYSGNWDFDGDGKKDKLLFVGTGGAHLYYHPEVVLSSDGRTMVFPFLETDFPLLLVTGKSNGQTVPGSFSIITYKATNLSAIRLHLDDAVVAQNKKRFRQQGIRSNDIVLYFKKKEPVIKDYKP